MRDNLKVFVLKMNYCYRNSIFAVKKDISILHGK